MFSRRLFLTSSAVAAVLALAPALAGDAPFNAAAFDEAQKAGKPILIEIHATWCPTCKAQAPILGKLFADPKFKDIVAFKVDFDSQKDLLRQFGARMQSTLIVFKGRDEVGRSVGDTNPDSIAALLAKAF